VVALCDSWVVGLNAIHYKLSIHFQFLFASRARSCASDGRQFGIRFCLAVPPNGCISLHCMISGSACQRRNYQRKQRHVIALA
jgi:hypothetical protein